MEIDHYLLEAMLEVDALYPDTPPIAPSGASCVVENRSAFLRHCGTFFESASMWVLYKPVTIGEYKTNGVSTDEVANMSHTQWNLLRWQLGWRP